MNHELKIWQQLGVGVTTYPLPKDIVCELKKSLPDDMQALKYVAFKVGDLRSRDIDHLEFDGMLATADHARQYHLTANEVREAFDRYVNNKNQVAPVWSAGQKPSPKKRSRIPKAKIAEPKVGLLLFRRDKRRGGSCRIATIEGETATVVWAHSGKKTKIRLGNLLNSALYSAKKIG